jgi:branched-chain amino acid transport system permease protein
MTLVEPEREAADLEARGRDGAPGGSGPAGFPGGRRSRARAAWERSARIAGSGRPPAQALRWALAIFVFWVAVHYMFGANALSFPDPANGLPNLMQGLALGSLYGIIGVGIILIYRTARLINFAAGAIGAIPAIVALLLDLQDHVNYLVVLPIVLVGGPLCGAFSEIVFMRRFSRSPRLIATVVTIGIAQSFAILGFFIPVWMGQKATNQGSLVPTPWQNLVLHNGRGQPTLTANQIAAFVAVFALTAGLGAFLRYTRLGIALRASAENADRAQLLGIPVKLVATTAWALAGLLSAVAIYVQAPIVGTPSDATLGFDTLLYGLTAAVVARMDSFWRALAAGLAIGVLITSSIIDFGDGSVASALMLVIILGALLLQRRQLARAFATGEGTWQTVKQFRPIPTELRNLPEVARLRYGLPLVPAALMVALPFIAGSDNISYITLLPLYGIVGVSLVVLTGWAGQISLGQFGLVGIAAGVSGGLIANHNIDFFVALGVGIGTGVVAAVIIGLPAVRIQGLYLAVTTLAFSYAVEDYALNSHYVIGRNILPSGLAIHLYRPVLYGIFNLQTDPRSFYYVCLIALGLCMACAYSFRRNRSGRVLIAARDNERAAPAYSINLARTRLAAFAVSGGIAGVAGVLFAYADEAVNGQAFDVTQSILVFLAAAIAGVGSLFWTVFGVMALEASVVFGPRLYDLLGPTLSETLPLMLTGPLLLLNMYFYPGGTAEQVFGTRDRWLRRLAERRGILVPSLVADRRVEEAAEQQVVLGAEHHLAETPVQGGSLEAGEPR